MNNKLNRLITQLSIPGKTFLAGEYLALAGGSALVAAMEPRFSLKVRPRNADSTVGQNPFHEQSLAGRWWTMHQALFCRYDLQFVDPYQGLGGFGASTAEFALLHGFWELTQSLCEESQLQFDLRRMWSDYRGLSETPIRRAVETPIRLAVETPIRLTAETPAGLANEGPSFGLRRPSGADLIGQVNGGLTVFDRQHGKVNQYGWEFENLGFLLFHTHRKLSTHEHLANLDNFETDPLQKIMGEIETHLSTANASGFVNGINEYAQELQRLGFVATHTQEILQQMSGPTILAKKGCGAMGADVICVIDRPEASARVEIKNQMQSLGCSFIADEGCLSGGLKVQWSHLETQGTSVAEVTL